MHNPDVPANVCADRARLDDALAWIDAHVGRLPAEVVALPEAAGRVLALDVEAKLDLPPFDRAAIDGFAVRADETIGAGAYNPLAFRLASAGHTLSAASAARVSAGDPLPSGADAVVALENIGDRTEAGVAIIEPAVPGNGVESRGSQVELGSRLVQAGRRLRPADVGLLASAGIRQVSVVRRPCVRCLLTGRNLAEAGALAPAGSVHDANGPLLASLVARDGGLLIDQRRVERTLAGIREALALPNADVILVAGSSGPGPDDHAAAAIAATGELAIHGVAVRPADTSGIGRLSSGALVLLMPGTPAACLWGYELLAGRAIRRLGGLSPALPFPSRTMAAASKIVSEIGVMEVCPVECLGDGRVAPVASFAEAGLAAAAEADGFVIVPEGSEGHARGAPVLVYLHEEAGPRLAADAEP
jgi:molybdopterin molybdotransferase